MSLAVLHSRALDGLSAPEVTAERKAFYQRIDREHLSPLWEVLGDLVPQTTYSEISAEDMKATSSSRKGLPSCTA